MTDHKEGALRVAEIFYSIQGEGLYVGTPSVFVRLFGCNFTCSGFSMPRGERSQERFLVDPEKYTKYNDLPLVHTGCDSYASWDHRFKHLSPWMTYSEIVEKIRTLLDGKVFNRNLHLIITGGEPLLWQDKIADLLWEIQLKEIVDKYAFYVTFETNGSQVLKWENYDRIQAECQEITWSISSKLPSSSGEDFEKAINPEAVKSYFPESYTDKCQGYFKWVVDNENDVKDIERAIRTYEAEDVELPVYLMPAGGTTKYYDENTKRVLKICMDNGWRYSPRMQIDMFGNQWGT